jgi:hypothetical protein
MRFVINLKKKEEEKLTTFLGRFTLPFPSLRGKPVRREGARASARIDFARLNRYRRAGAACLYRYKRQQTALHDKNAPATRVPKTCVNGAFKKRGVHRPLSVSSINHLVVFYDIHDRKREVLFFILSRTPYETH